MKDLEEKKKFINELCNILGGDENSPIMFKVLKYDNDFNNLKNKFFSPNVLDENDELCEKLIEMYKGDIIFLKSLLEEYNIK